MLDPDPPAVERVPGIGNVAGREDIGSRGLEPRVNHDAVIHLESRFTGQIYAWHNADPDHREVALNPATAARPDRREVLVTLERLHSVAEREPDVVVSVNVAVEPPYLLTEDSLVWQLQRVDQRYLEPHLPGRCRYLGSNPPRSHHRQPTTLLEAGVQRVGVSQRA